MSRMYGQAYSPPCKGGEDATSIRCREATFERSGRGGRLHATLRCEPPPRLRHFGCLAPFFLLAQPPLLFKEGNGQEILCPNANTPANITNISCES